MSRKAIATKETVAEAVEKLIQAGLNPTVAQVRDRLGGGSYTTISRLLAQLPAERERPESAVAEMPADLAEIAHRAVLAIYGAIQKAANARVEILEREAGLRISQAERARLEAELEIESLERDAEALEHERDAARATAQDAIARAERAEGKFEAIARESERLRAEVDQLRREVQHARDEGTVLREQLGTELDRASAESARLAAQIASLQTRKRPARSASGREA